MASQSLYRKWRSQTFSDLIGQEAVVRTLLNAVRDGRLSHAYLFSGPRGTGKTSVARLLAKAVNCEHPRDGEPCNECVSCQEIAAGRSPDVIEIDAASNNGVDNIRELRENANLMGSGGRYKVYIIDEAHMLTTQAWNAFLKTLEEPPPHILFVFATTEAHKVMPTVMSRCQRFDFRRIRMTDIVARLKQVADGEGLTLEPAAADLLARAAQGGMRDALSLLDQAVAFCGQTIDLERTRAMLGLADVGALRRMITSIADDRAADALDQLNDLVVGGADLRQLNSQLADEWRALMLARAGADLTHVMDYTEEEARDLATLAGRFSLDELMACARVFARNEGPARGLPMPQLALELSLLDCLRVRRHDAPDAAVAAAPSASAPQPMRASQPAAPAPTPMPRAATQPAPAPSRPQELDLAAIDAGTWAGPGATPTTSTVSDGPSAPDEPEIYPPDDAFAEEEESAATWGDERESASADGRDWVAEALQSWPLVRKLCRQKPPMGAVVGGLLSAAEPIRFEAGEPVTLVIRTKFDVHLNKLRDPGMREVVEWALEQALGTRFRVHFVPPSEQLRGSVAARPKAASGPAGSASVAQAATTAQPQVYERGATPRATPGPATGASNGATRRDTDANGYRPASAQTAPPPRGTPPGRAEVRERPAASSAPQSPEAVKLEQAAREDPVVQELARMLNAEVAEVRPLDPPETDDY